MRFCDIGGFVVSIAFMIAAAAGSITRSISENCNFFQGSWKADESYPLYSPHTCPFISREFNCLQNGRPDHFYLNYRWQPDECSLRRFNGEDFLLRHKGKRIMFVGDSLSRNQWVSFTCMLHASVPQAQYRIDHQAPVSTFQFPDYDVKIYLHHSVFLVDVEKEKIGLVLKLDSIKAGRLWRGMDMLIFNTWHWWSRRGLAQPWDYIQDGDAVLKDMDPLLAFKKALMTWAGWVNSNINSSKTKVFFQGISPSHYNALDWNESSRSTCLGQQVPISGTTYPGTLPVALTVLKEVLATMTKPVHLLDITNLSSLRKDAHPSVYGLQNTTDCSHWCLAGVPDTWNEILYNLSL